MDKEFILEKLKLITDCSANEKEAAFQFLIKMILKKINLEQGLKIEGLGIFQLKNEPLLREERKGLANINVKKNTLIYAPIYDDKSNLSNLFISIEIDDDQFQEVNEIDKIFSLGFGKPTIPLPGQNFNSFLKKIKDYRIKKTFEEIITELVEKAEILDDFNIFTDYIEKSFTNPLNESNVETIKELITESDTIDTSLKDLIDKETNNENVLDNDTAILPNENNSVSLDEKLAAEDITDESIEKLFSDEELDKVFISEPAKTDDKEETSEDKNDIIDKEPIQESLIIDTEEIEFDQVPESDKPNDKDSIRKTMFDKLDEILTKSDTEEILNEVSENDDSQYKRTNIDENTVQSSAETTQKKYHFYESFIFWFVTIFIIVLIIVGYLVIPNYFVSKSKTEKNIITENKNPVKKTIESKIDTIKNNNDSTASDILNKPLENKSEEKSLYRTPPQDKRISNQVYYDGAYYTVQVSSWLDKSIAENEVMKLRAKGFDAFIYQAYVPSKGSTWSRVRIGYFKSANEAEKFLINNQMKE